MIIFEECMFEKHFSLSHSSTLIFANSKALPHPAFFFPNNSVNKEPKTR